MNPNPKGIQRRRGKISKQQKNILAMFRNSPEARQNKTLELMKRMSEKKAFVISVYGRIEYANERAQMIIGLSLNDLVGRKIVDLVKIDTAKKLVNSKVVGMATEPYIHEYLRPDGSFCQYSIRSLYFLRR